MQRGDFWTSLLVLKSVATDRRSECLRIPRIRLDKELRRDIAGSLANAHLNFQNRLEGLSELVSRSINISNILNRLILF